MLKAILFDLDNTLIDFMELKKTACHDSIKAMINAGLEMDEKKAYRLLFDVYYKYGLEYGKIFQKFLLETTGRVDVKILSAGIVAYRFAQARNRKPYRNVIPALKVLKKKYKLGIVSDAPTLKAWIRLQELGIADYFDVVITLEGKKMKPNRLPFMKAARKLGISTRHILFVGDQPHRDIKGAKELGMKTALAQYGIQKAHRKYLKENKPDFYLRDIKDILDVVKELDR